MAKQSYGLGLVGTGNFGQFCLNAFRKLPNLNLVAVCDKDVDRSQATAAEFGMASYTHVDDLLANSAVDIVAINTPPSSHAALSMAALHTGKHVFCEKPLATSLADAKAVLGLARETGVILSVDYIMRANPLYRLVKQLSELKVGDKPAFGNLRRCSLENFAADENLVRDHWFWDQSISGGIFVEHGVHFFDLFGWQLGRLPNKVVALAEAREGGPVDTVQAIVSYEGGATSSSFHTFTHANAGEFQSIVFGWDWAVAELHGWIALDLRLEALLDMESVELLAEKLAPRAKLLEIPGEPLLPEARLSWRIVEQFPGDRMMKGHGEERRIDAKVVVQAKLGQPDAKLSAELVQADMTVCPWLETTFHGVVSWNALYHNTISNIQLSIDMVYDCLLPNGLFMGTFKSTKADTYGLGPEIEPNTFICPDGPDQGQLHCFFDETAIRQLFEGWEFISLVEQRMKYLERGQNFLEYNPFPYTTWCVLARKKV